MSNDTRTSPPSDHRRRARKKRAPSGRDQAIFIEHRTRGRSQAELAQEYGLSLSRISQIIRRVERWRADLDPAAEGQLDDHQQRRLERWLMREKYQAIYDRAIRAFDQAPKELTITRVEYDGAAGATAGLPSSADAPASEPTKTVLTTRQHVANVQLLKVAQRATSDLGCLAELEPLPSAAEQTRDEKRAMAEELVTELLDEAVAGNKVRSVGDERLLVDDFFKFILGEPHGGLAVNIIAADAEHGRRRDDHQPYSSRDQMLVPTEDSLMSPNAAAESAICNSFNSSNPSNSANAESPEVQPPQADSTKTGHSKPSASNTSTLLGEGLPPLLGAGLPTPPKAKKSESDPELEAYLRLGVPYDDARRARYWDKIREVREASAAGRPCMVWFDPDEGPPQPLEYVVADPGWRPTPRDPKAEAAAVQDYLATLRAMNERNRLEFLKSAP